jgi:hypothetical protein
MGIAALDKARAFGVSAEAGRKFQGAELMGGAVGWAHLLSFYLFCGFTGCCFIHSWYKRLPSAICSGVISFSTILIISFASEEFFAAAILYHI